jgi:hypothetical protein
LLKNLRNEFVPDDLEERTRRLDCENLLPWNMRQTINSPNLSSQAVYVARAYGWNIGKAKIYKMTLRIVRVGLRDGEAQEIMISE